MLTVLKNEFVTIWVYPESKIVHHKFHAQPFGDPFREATLTGAEAFIKYRCTKWLSDDRHSSALLQSDMDWVGEKWEPIILPAGWQYWAILLPIKMVGKVNMHGIIERYKAMGVVAQVFENTEKAMEWLKSV